MAAVEKAILKSDLRTPINDGKIIRIAIPPLTPRKGARNSSRLPANTGGNQDCRARRAQDCNDTLKKAEKGQGNNRRRAEKGYR